jgi:hypothetical protein
MITREYLKEIFEENGKDKITEIKIFQKKNFKFIILNDISVYEYWINKKHEV